MHAVGLYIGRCGLVDDVARAPVRESRNCQVCCSYFTRSLVAHVCETETFQLGGACIGLHGPRVKTGASSSTKSLLS